MHSGNCVDKQIQYGDNSEARNRHTPRVALGTATCRLDSVQMQSEFREKCQR